MIVIGDELIPFENMFFIDSIEKIVKTKSNSTIIFKYNESLLEYASRNSLSFAVKVSNIKDSIYSNALNAKYLVCEKDFAKELQKIAENYMFDSKVLAMIDSNDEFEEIAKCEIDGVIYNKLLK